MPYKDLEIGKERRRKWYLDNRERILKEGKIRRKNNYDPVKEQERKKKVRSTAEFKAKDREYHRLWNIKHKEKLKKKRKDKYELRKKIAYDYLGGKCTICKKIEKLEFDHIDPDTKLFAITKTNLSEERFWVEIKKCQLLCRECHIKKTKKEFTGKKISEIPNHGTDNRYKHFGCRCDLCRHARSTYTKQRQQ